MIIFGFSNPGLEIEIRWTEFVCNTSAQCVNVFFFLKWITRQYLFRSS